MEKTVKEKTMTQKKKHIILLCIIAVVLVAIITTVTILCINKTNERKLAKQDIIVTLDSILNRSEKDGYILGMNMSSSASLLNSNETSDKINSLISYSIDSVKIKNLVGTVKISIVSPDLHTILKDINATEEIINDSDKLLSEINQSLNSDEYPKFETTIEAQIEKLGDHWFLIPNSQLSNALSGNLTQAYSQLGNNIINELIEGDSNE